MKKILIVEDEPDIQELLKTYLEDAGYQTAVAGDGVAALSLFQSRPFDLVLLAEEGGDYRRPLRAALHERLKALGAEGALGAKGGIHLIPAAAAAVVLPWARTVLPETGEDIPAGPEEETPPEEARAPRLALRWQQTGGGQVRLTAELSHAEGDAAAEES